MSWVVGSVRSEAFREIFLRFHENIPGVTVTVRMGGEGKKGRCHCQLVLGRTDGYHGTGARKASERKILNKNEMDGYVVWVYPWLAPREVRKRLGQKRINHPTNPHINYLSSYLTKLKGRSSALDLFISPRLVRKELPGGRRTEDAALAEAECSTSMC